MANPILEELHDIRKQILAEYGDDLSAYLRAELEKTKASGHPIAKIKQRIIQSTEAANSRELRVENESSPPGCGQRCPAGVGPPTNYFNT